jgi:hypothetical protein
MRVRLDASKMPEEAVLPVYYTTYSFVCDFVFLNKFFSRGAIILLLRVDGTGMPVRTVNG